MSEKGAAKSPVFQETVSYLQQQFAGLPDCRVGKNQTISMRDIGLSAFSVFFTQSPSFLEYQRRMNKRSGKNNAKSLFGIEAIPSDNHIRKCLDPVNPSALFPVFHYGLKQVKKAGLLDSFRYFSEQLLLAVDGVHYFSSKQIHCKHCNKKQHQDGSISYSHSMLSAALVHPSRSEVLPLPPEFIEPQDGQNKEDSERAAIKRWLEVWGQAYSKLNVTLLGDDLYACQPICEAVISQGLHFIFTCKETSHKCLYEWITSLKNADKLEQIERTLKFKGKIFRYQCQYVNQVPIRDGADAMNVNWLLVHVFDNQNKLIYRGAFITDHELTDTNVVEIAQAARTRWKIENEHNNTLKNHGYHLEHNYGHGKQHLATLLCTLILLSFMFHTLLALLDRRYQCIRQHLTRKMFFRDLHTVTGYLRFDSWDALLECMLQSLELNSS